MRKHILLTLSLVLLTAWGSQAAEARADTLDLRDFGAVGDGITDDGPALQSALDALAADGGGTLFVPGGRYAIITPVSKDFSGLASSVTILGVESYTFVDGIGSADTLTAGLELASEFLPKTGASQIAIRIAGLQSFQIRDISFMGTPDVANDAMITLALDTIEDATIRHCEFYGLVSQTQGGAIVLAHRSRLKIEQSKFLGCTGNSGESVPVVQNLRWKSITVTNAIFVDYGQRQELYGKTGLGASMSWINIGNAEAISSDSPRREVVINNIFLDEGAYFGISSLPNHYQPPSAPIDLVFISGLRMNVTNLAASGNQLNDVRAVLIESSRYEWSQNAFAAIDLRGVDTAILDEVECLASANRIYADTATVRLTVINSIYNHLDSEAQTTDVINTERTKDDPVQYVRQQYESILRRAPDPAGHYYWSNLILLCEGEAGCVDAAWADLDKYLNAAPSPNFSIVGQVLDEDGNPMADVTVTVGGSQAVVTQTDADGRYRFSDLPTSGDYAVTASRLHYTFDQPSLSFITPTHDRTAAFIGTLNSHMISGRVTKPDGTGLSGVTLTLSGSQAATAVSNSSGDYSFDDLPAGGNYTVALTKTRYTFQPSMRRFKDLGADKSAAYVGTVNSHTVSGRVIKADGGGLAGVTLTLSGSQAATVVTNSSGDYSFPGLPGGGNYTVAVSKVNHSFNPQNNTWDDLGADQVANFAGQLVSYQISGHVTVNGTALVGVTLTVSGSQSAAVTTGMDGSYSLMVPAEGNYTVMPSSAQHTFNPTSVSINNLSEHSIRDFVAILNPGVPVLISVATSTRALSLDSVLQTREPFQLSYTPAWNSNHRTRLMLFAMNFELAANESAESVSAEGEDGSHLIYPLAVEYVGKVPGLAWLNCIVVRLDDNLGDVGDILVRVTYRGVSSNRVRIGIGHIGGGLPDDEGSFATPGRAPR